MYGFRFYFTPLTGVLFTFPSRYWCAIGHQVVLSLGRWSSRIPTRFLGPRGTQDLRQASQGLFAYGAVTRCGRPFQTVQLRSWFVTRRQRRDIVRQRPSTPHIQRPRAWHMWGLGYSLFARHYWGNRGCFLFLQVLRCFTSLRGLRSAYGFRGG